MADSETSARWRRIKEMVGAALDLDAAARSAFLLSACAGDEALLAEARSLVAAAEKDWSFVDSGAAASLRLSEVPGESSRIGERIGPYEILSELGRGGMGQVFLARRADDEFRKRVAIKLVPPGPARAFALARFRSERQISATLEHPHIARLLDGGTTSAGEPYIVMEYVEGRPLVAYAEEHRLSTEERLRLFRQVCEAVQYAHRNLVVHRDIKPSNILVTAEGVPKLLDFGIAKLLDPEETASGAETGTLVRIMTPDYASPEQVRGERVSTASDVYSLGVVLYELLSGKKPYRIETGDPAELVRRVCEQDPEKPSQHAPRLSGDLDAIVLKAMRKEPELRYPSADALSADIGRYLDGRAVEARRGSAAYRLRKFARRNRVAVAAAALLLAALGGGVGMTLVEAHRARLAEGRAERRFGDVRRLAHSFLFEFNDAIRDLPGSTPARALLVRRGLEYLDGLAREAGGDRGLRRELAEAYQKVGDVQGNPYHANLGDIAGAIASYDKAIMLLEPVVSAGGASDSEMSTLASAQLVGGGIRLVAGDIPSAVAMSEKGLRLRQALAEKNPNDEARQMDLAQAYQFDAFSLSAAGRERESYEALHRQADILRWRLTRDPKDRRTRRSLDQNLFLRGQALADRHDAPGAREAFLEAAEIGEGLRQEDGLNTQFQRDLGYIYLALGGISLDERRSDAAGEELERALALFTTLASSDPNSVDGRLGIATARQNLGAVAAQAGRSEEALGHYGAARTIFESLVASDPTNAWAAGLLAELYLMTGEAEEALGRPLSKVCELYRRSAESFEKLRAENRLLAPRREASERAERAVGRCRDVR